jgi:hypothetical protein
LSNCGEENIPVNNVIKPIVIKLSFQLFESNGDLAENFKGCKSGPGEGLPVGTVNRDLDCQISLVKVTNVDSIDFELYHNSSKFFCPLLPIRAHNPFPSS